MNLEWTGNKWPDGAGAILEVFDFAERFIFTCRPFATS